MKPMTKAVAVALIQLLVVCSLGAKLLYDRRTRPRAWFRTERYDPDLPIRGRYLSLQIDVNDPRSAEEIRSRFESEIDLQAKQTQQFGGRFFDFGRECGAIEVQGDNAVAVFEQNSQGWNCDNLSFSRRQAGDRSVLRLNEPVLFFIPDTAKDPSRLSAGEELWVLATVPRKGPPRPIMLGIKKAGDPSPVPLTLN